MKINWTYFLLVGLGCALGVLASFIFRSETAPVHDSDAVAPKVVRSTIPDAKASAVVALERALRKRIKQLEAELEEARAALPPATNPPPAGAVQVLPNRAEIRMPSPREWMADMKKNDPKRYEEFRQRAAQMRRMRMERTKGRLDYLSSLDTAGMTKDEKSNHEALQRLLERRETLTEIAEDMTEEELRAAMTERRDLEREIRKANTVERETLLRQMTVALGLEGEDAQALTETIRDVIDATEGGPGMMPPPPPGN